MQYNLKTSSGTTTTLKRHLKTHPTTILKYQKYVQEKLTKTKETVVLKRQYAETQIK